MKPSGIINFENVPADAGDPDVKIYVNGEEVSSGGGGGDFSTCTVTPGTDGIETFLPVVDEENDTIKMQYSPSDPVKVVLYKGSLQVDTLQLVVDDISGDAVYDSDNDIVTVTGDCTFSAHSPK